MSEVKNRNQQERVVFGPNVNQPKSYVNPDTNRPVVS